MFEIYPPALIERLTILSARLNTLAAEDPELSGSQRASLMLAVHLVDQVGDQQVEITVVSGAACACHCG